MTRTAVHAVNVGLAIDRDAPVPEVADFDIDLSARNVLSWGGDPALYVHFLTAALRAGGPDDFLTISALAAWRSGVVDLRADALRRVVTSEVGTATIAAAIGIELHDVPIFVERQQTDVFTHPLFGDGPPGRLVASVGGFRGIGGPWSQPPADATYLGDGRFRLRVGDTWWSLVSDVFGARVTRADQSGESLSTSGAPVAASSVHLVVTRTSHRAFLLTGAAA